MSAKLDFALQKGEADTPGGKPVEKYLASLAKAGEHSVSIRVRFPNPCFSSSNSQRPDAKPEKKGSHHVCSYICMCMRV